MQLCEELAAIWRRDADAARTLASGYQDRAPEAVRYATKATVLEHCAALLESALKVEREKRRGA